jgi:hypothetical protein
MDKLNLLYCKEWEHGMVVTRGFALGAEGFKPSLIVLVLTARKCFYALSGVKVLHATCVNHEFQFEPIRRTRLS